MLRPAVIVRHAVQFASLTLTPNDIQCALMGLADTHVAVCIVTAREVMVVHK